ncbi:MULTISPECIES: YbaB/EbfC family nucleoid-associated protein [unclassified Crossiella]|uniref:YbaB/EbfC family nucleoid-associated protein n=1 Tax=Crossiella sp. CA-258035 TaxID=2981138 RepID=UPI0024BC8A51|nr:YbaB/EbfC family nucleoid-associated protein [Crossiella sp. CA-258035]WHT20345.1 YbaB/EbfC family nucleoid-associated protein [Crossiella sp. CA-258035]
MPTDHKAQVAELIADYRRSRDQLGTVQRAFREVRESASSEDGVVTVTVGPRGTLLDLRITEQAYQRYRAAELAALVLEVTAAAAELAAASAQRALAPLLPADADPQAVLDGSGDLTTGELNLRARQADEDFEQQNWLRAGGER